MSITSTTSKVRLLALGAVTVLGLLSACTPSEKPASPEELAAADAKAKSAGTNTGCAIDKFTVEGAPGAKPKVTLPSDCPAPTALLQKDLVEGTGTALKSGDVIEAHYHLSTFSDKKEKETSYTNGQPFQAPIGAGRVIKGWDQGLIGIKPGGRRLLVVPPSLGYGERGGQGMAPNETLVFVVDALKVTPGAGH
ncbi:peptidylprolyl isomerase [Crossiella equi]|uniref:Peptidyl-prolyl cis-trans isomerase n=1 Tax=Crossiella equi TaxID=130796 RepID=A0ABS5APX5_9PSEU|nr:FKBP-type peptidyl-prolyl cis-trans isomerase [Crossiella equi]MBP2478307.1 peptidylprolyl isomerase [Crossiella equi]